MPFTVTMFKLGYRPYSRVSSYLQFLSNQEKDMITFRNCEIELNLHNKAQNKHHSQYTTLVYIKLPKYLDIRKLLKNCAIINYQITLGI